MPFTLGCRPISGFPLFASSSEGGCTPSNPSRFGAAPKWTDKDWIPPTLHDLERLLQKEGLHPPNTIRSGSQMDKDWTPQPFTIWSGSQMDKDWTPPNPSRFGAVPKWTRIGRPQPFTTWRVFLSRKLTADFLLPKSAEKNVPFALGCRPISSLTESPLFLRHPPGPPYRKSNENPPVQPLRKPKPERDRLTENTHTLLFVAAKVPPAQPHRKSTASSGTRQHSFTDSPLLLPTPARTASQNGHMRTRQHSLTESPIQQTRTDTHAVLPVSSQFPPAQPHRKPIASVGIGQDSLTESPHENPPTQPHRKPNPERDKLAERPHAVPRSILPGPR